MFKSNTKYSILTPDGFLPFEGINLTKKDKILKLYLSNGLNLECSLNHRIKISDTKFVEAQNLNVGDEVLTFSGIDKISKIENLVGKYNLYDPINVGIKKEYISNGIISHNCQFLGTGDTYIDGETLTHISKNVNNDYGIRLNGRLRVWDPPINVYNYLISIDSALGTGRNYSAFHVINLYNGLQVAEFYSNTTPLDELADIAAQIGYEYNNAYITYERNTIGYNLKYHLFERIQYPNLIVDPDSNGDEFGILTTPKVREQMLAKLEEFIRLGKIKIRSQRTIEELFTFIVNESGKVQADEGKNDDLVMSLALAIHAITYLYETTPIDQSLNINYLEQPAYSNASNFKQKHSFDIEIADNSGKRIKEDYKWILYG